MQGLRAVVTGLVLGCVQAVGAGPLTSPATWRAFGPVAHGRLGNSLAAAGDVNGDGYDDLIVGAPDFDPGGQPLAGRVYLYLGGLGGPRLSAWTASGIAGERFGSAVSAAGDVNGDGFGDVVVGAPGDGLASVGRAAVYYGSPSGLSPSPQWTQSGPGAGSGFGGAARSAGDVNGDGFDDLLVGAPGASPAVEREGAAFLYLGSPAGLQSAPAWTARSDVRLAAFGAALGSAGDVNGDGFADVVVGAPNWAIWLGPDLYVDYGRIYVYHGSAAGLSATPAREITPTQPGSNYGQSVGTAGDVDGDGFDDVIVGAFEWTVTVVEQGAAFVYAGSASGLTAQPAWTALGQGPGEVLYLGWSVGTAGDIDADGYADVVVGMMAYPGFPQQPGVCGRVLVFQGSASGLAAAPAWTFTGRGDFCGLGWAVGTAGDVNGDGCADVAAGAPFWDTVAGEDAGLVRVGLTRRCGR
jgi:FG-GAP repeat protein